MKIITIQNEIVQMISYKMKEKMIPINIKKECMIEEWY